jgi:hypothetical protein
VTALGVAGVFAASSAATTACTTHQCDSDFVNIDQSTGMFVGDMQPGLNPGTVFWESSPLDGTWIDFPGERSYFFSLPPYFTPISPPQAWVATTPNAADSDGGGTYVQAGGQLAEYGAFVNGGFIITNATCAEYYLYVSVQGTYNPPPAPAPAADDAGAD